jgi:hypothetical protein
MTDPVDTDALNTNWLRSVAGTLHSKASHLMNAAADEVDRLRAVIENAPHGKECRGRWVVALPRNIYQGCTCWKADAL